MDKHVVLS